MFALISIIDATDDDKIDRFILGGFMVLGVLPTTVASNIAMTRTAKGNEEAATAEVCIGESTNPSCSITGLRKAV